MSDLRICDTCKYHDWNYCPSNHVPPRCEEWTKIPCPKCGGTLSAIREHNGKRYRHCYSCHSEFEEES